MKRLERQKQSYAKVTGWHELAMPNDYTSEQETCCRQRADASETDTYADSDVQGTRTRGSQEVKRLESPNPASPVGQGLRTCHSNQ